ncbi:MAG: iron ABC transporter permease [Acidiferrobacteraceae bacterium]|nr:iron ABC transporter permease [Acidiferrobacteraceae bacterium]
MHARRFLSHRRLNYSGWSIGSTILALLVLTPIISVLYLAFRPTGDIWSHLLSTSLPIYLGNSFFLMLGVGFLVFAIGVSTAWLVTMCSFPGRQIFEWLLLIPLAMPAYVIAYAYTDLLEFSGIVQSTLRITFDWGKGDYWFPAIRSLGGAIFVMGMVLYPYVYLLARSAFLEQSVNVLEASQTLGRGPWRTFFSVSLPTARSAIVIGMALALMETFNDYGTVSFFAVPTLTAGLIDVWLGLGSLSAGAQIASLMLVIVLVLLTIEYLSRRQRIAYQQPSSRFRSLPTHRLNGFRSFIAIITCVTPIVVGFFIPVAILSRLSFKYFDQSWTKDFQVLALNSFVLAAIAAVICVVLAIFINYSRRLQPRTTYLTFMTRFSSLGYAIPGAVLAIGILVPFAAFDNYVDSQARKIFGLSTGLILSGTVGALLFAYVVRFLMIAIGQIGSSLEKVSLSIDMAARTLGNGARQTVVRYHVPLIKGSILSALTIVFVDCMKELPATLILRPFGFETLATHVYHYASDENLGEAALGSILIVATGLLPVIILCRVIAQTRQRSGS